MFRILCNSRADRNTAKVAGQLQTLNNAEVWEWIVCPSVSVFTQFTHFIYLFIFLLNLIEPIQSDWIDLIRLTDQVVPIT